MIRSRSRTVGAAALAAALLFTAACSDDDDGDAASTDTETTADDAGAATDPYDTDGGTATDAETDASDDGSDAAAPTIAVADSDLGSILVDGQGITLYVFSNDTQGEASTCTDGCTAAWPAVSGTVSPGDGVDESLIGTVTNDDGSEHATYDGWPLYYYAEDSGPGDTNGQGVGGVWWVIDAEGTPIES